MDNERKLDPAILRVGRRLTGRKLLSLRRIKTVLKEEALANFVPAAAVIRRGQALSGLIGRKGFVGGLKPLKVKD